MLLSLCLAGAITLCVGVASGATGVQVGLSVIQEVIPPLPASAPGLGAKMAAYDKRREQPLT